jgi:hypothetical protein
VERDGSSRAAQREIVDWRAARHLGCDA